MLQTNMAPSSAMLRPYVWAYGMTTGLVGSVPLVIPLPARPKQLLTFTMVKRDGIWKIAHFQNTVIDPKAENEDIPKFDATGFPPPSDR